MKDYNRLTSYMQVGDKIVAIQPQRKERIQMYIDRLFDLEDKIESGELCDREEVRKETAREILQIIRDSAHIHFAMRKIAKKYGVKLEEQQ